MAKIESGCCLASQAIEQSKDCKKRIDSLVTNSSNDAQRIRHLEENLTIAGLFFTALFVFLCASIVAACAEVNRTRSQIDRLNADVDFLEKQVFKTGGLNE